MPERATAGEEALIQGFLARLAASTPAALGLKDDCAMFAPEPGRDLVLTTDAVAAGVHFFADDPPADIGWKALAVNVSDLAAKGARPLYYLMALAFPERPSEAWMQDFAAGLERAQAEFGCTLVGGDTDRRAGPVSVTITALGSVPSGRMVRRATARPGDLVYVTGTLGDAALGLALRRDASRAKTWALAPKEAMWLVGRYLRPEPRVALAPALLEYATAAMDISDGLAKDLGRMVDASGVGAVVAANAVPLSPATAHVLRADPARRSDVLAGGDDYEILFTISPSAAASLETAAAAAGIAVTHIGEIVTGTEVAFIDGAGSRISLPQSGYDHF